MENIQKNLSKSLFHTQILESELKQLDLSAQKTVLQTWVSSLDELNKKDKASRVSAFSAGILEKLLSYMKILSGLLEIRILCIVNLKTYLSEEQLKEVYQMAFYCKLQLLLIENREQSNLEGEKTYIIDRDRCLIIK